jgi:hypothetical protein
MAVHEYTEVGHRMVGGLVEVIYGCVCGGLTAVASGSRLLEARRQARQAVAEHSRASVR